MKYMRHTRQRKEGPNAAPIRPGHQACWCWGEAAAAAMLLPSLVVFGLDGSAGREGGREAGEGRRDEIRSCLGFPSSLAAPRGEVRGRTRARALLLT